MTRRSPWVRAGITLLTALLFFSARPAAAQDSGEEEVEELKASGEATAATGEELPAAEGEAADGEAAEDPTDRSPTDAVLGHIGIGYFTDSAPLGLRYWFDRDMAFDVGLDGRFSSGGLDGYQLGAEVGFVYALGHYHYAVAFARAGIGWRVSGLGGQNAIGNARHDINVNAFLGVELFLGALGFPNVSLQGGYGLQAAWVVDGGTSFMVGTTEPTFNLFGAGSVGFHIYL